WPAKFGVNDADVVRLANPISQEESVLRPSLLINLLRAVSRNLNHQRSSVMLFEVGHVFNPSEEQRLAIVVAGEASPKTWKQPALPVDITYLKGLLEALIRDTGAAATLAPGAKASFLHPSQSFSIVHRGKTAGAAGILDPRTAAAFDIGAPCAVVEVRLAALTGDSTRAAAPLPKYPFVERDIAVVVEKTVAWDTLRAAAEKAGGALVVGVWPFDLFEGGSLAASQKSVAFRVRLQDPNKTLAESDINGAVERIKSTLQKSCGAQLR
ncbi:MAG: hypothetical protein JO102_04565, partial [Elusimicrobia bacterium]|nr:hypothetical protein [Elusimicrobiota bacterium]